MKWLILTFALLVGITSYSLASKLPPASSSPVPKPVKQFEDVKFAQLLNVPPDILYRLPLDEAKHIAGEARAGKEVSIGDKLWLT